MEISYIEKKFDLYDLAALAYLYKRIKETDGIREASHVIVDEAQDFGMMAYGALAYCLRDVPIQSWEISPRISISGMDSMTGRSLETAAYRPLRQLSGVEKELPEYGGDFQICHRDPPPWKLPGLSCGTCPPPWKRSIHGPPAKVKKNR